MRTYRMRWDLFICFILTCLIGAILYKVEDVTKLFSNALTSISTAIEDSNAKKNAGKLGEFATDSTNRLTLNEEALRNASDLFTIEIDSETYDNLEKVYAGIDTYYLLDLDNGKKVAVKMHTSRTQHPAEGTSGMCVLPVGKISEIEPDIYDELNENFADSHDGEGEIVSDYFIDMTDGQPNGTFSSEEMGLMLAVTIGLPILFLALFLGCVLGIHRVGVKIGVFPPIFAKKMKQA